MNYILLINSFIDRASEDPSMKATYRTVFHALAHINNKCGWKLKFHAEYREVMHWASIKSKDTYYEAVKYLSDHKYINYEKGKNEYSTATFELLAEYEKTGKRAGRRTGKRKESEQESEPESKQKAEGISVGKQAESEPESGRNIIHKHLNNKTSKHLNNKTEDSDSLEQSLDDSEKKEKEKSSGKKEKEVAEIVFPFDTENFRAWWNRWRDYRKNVKKKPYKSLESEQGALQQLSEFNEEFSINLIKNSISNEWQGLVFNRTQQDYQDYLRNGNTKTSKQQHESNDWDKLEHRIISNAMQNQS